MTSIVSLSVPGPFDGSTRDKSIHWKRNISDPNCTNKNRFNGNPRSCSTHSSKKSTIPIDGRSSTNHRNDEEETCCDPTNDISITKQQKENIPKLKKSKKSNSKNCIQREEKDRELAQQLQDKENRIFQQSLDRAHKAMLATNVGKAILAVERVIRMVDSMKIPNELFQFELSPVAKDDMVFFAEQLLAKQEEFKARGIPSEVDIGYHYTSEASMLTIQRNGLMTREDRIKNNIHVKSKGAIFGDGVYTANNPISFMKFGRVGLLVARLQGKTLRIANRLGNKDRKASNTIIGDKKAKSRRWWWPKSDSFHEIVLQDSSQCLPLVRYDRESLRGLPVQKWDPDACLCIIAEYLKAIVDEIFNGREPARPLPALPLSSGNQILAKD